MRKIFYCAILICLFCLTAKSAWAYQPRIVYSQTGGIQISNPEISQVFFDELKGQPRDYFISSDTDFDLYINVLVPAEANRDGRYSFDIFQEKDGAETMLSVADSLSADWSLFYEPFSRDYYFKGPEFSQNIPAGNYKIEVFSTDDSSPTNFESEGASGSSENDSNSKLVGDKGKYVLAMGQKESYDIQSILNTYWQIPFLKLTFFNTSVLQFFLTPFGIAAIGFLGAILIFFAIIYYLIGLIRQAVKHGQAKTLLLTSGGMEPMKDEIIKLLQKPAYDITVAFIATASKPEEDLEYVNRDLIVMREELRFNVEEVDIEGKTEKQVEKLLELKDIVFVEGGNAFYLLKVMRKCNFEKVIRKLLKLGKVYIGASAGSMVAGRTIKTGLWKHPDKNIVGLRNLKSLNLVPFDIFMHYEPKWDDTIKKHMKSRRKRLKKLKILTDEQAILVQGREVDLIGEGEAVVV